MMGHVISTGSGLSKCKNTLQLMCHRSFLVRDIEGLEFGLSCIEVTNSCILGHTLDDHITTMLSDRWETTGFGTSLSKNSDWTYLNKCTQNRVLMLYNSCVCKSVSPAITSKLLANSSLPLLLS